MVITHCSTEVTSTLLASISATVSCNRPLAPSHAKLGFGIWLSLPTFAFSVRTPLRLVAALGRLGRPKSSYILGVATRTTALTWSVCCMSEVVGGMLLLICYRWSRASEISMRAHAGPMAWTASPFGYYTFRSCGLEVEGLLSCTCCCYIC